MSKRTIQRSNKRIPLAERALVKTETKKGFVRRWVSDAKEGRIQDLVNAGYNLVKSDGTEVKQDASLALDDGSWKTRTTGGGKSYLMEIPEELYHADQLAKEAKIQKQEQAVMDDITDHSMVVGDGVKIDTAQNRKSGRPKVQTI